jgi:chromosome segregation ATPase
VDIETEPTEYQVRYWKTRALTAEAQLKQERKRKEPETLREAEKALRDAQQTIRSINDDRQVWKKISHEAYLRIDQLEREGAAAVLKRERDHWRKQWRACTRRLGNCIEHLGLDHTGLEPDKDA